MVTGLLLIVLGALLVVAAVFTATGTDVEIIGLGVNAITLFLLGLASGLAILWGFTLTKWGTKRSLRQRRDAKRIQDLSAELERRKALPAEQAEHPGQPGAPDDGHGRPV